MSYVRFGGDSDVYLYYSVYGYRVCCCCRLGPMKGAPYTYFDDQKLKSVGSALVHIGIHRMKGHRVPLYVSQCLKEDLVRGEEAKRKFRRRIDLLHRIQQRRFPEEY